MRDFFVKQRDHRQCGSASLSMVCAILGKRVSLRYLDTLCPPSKEGISIRALKEGASSLGLKTTTGYLDCENLRKLPLPAILFWDGNHYVVLYGMDKKGRFMIADPMSCKRKISESELRKHWLLNETENGIAMAFEKTEDFSEHPDETAGNGTLLKYIKTYFQPYLKYYIAFLIGLFIAAAIQLLFPFLTQFIVDKAIPAGNLRLIWIILAGELLLVMGKCVSNFIRRWLIVKINNKVDLVMKGDFIIKFLSLPMSFYERRTSGDILQRISDLQRIQVFLTTHLLGAIYCVILIIGLVIILMIYSVIICLIIISFMVLYSGWTLVFLKKRRALDMLSFKANAEANDATLEIVNSPQEIKVHGCLRHQLMNWENRITSVMDVQIRKLILQQSLEGGNTLLKETRNLLVNVIAALQVIGGNLSLGEMFAIMFILGQLSGPLEQLVRFILDFQDVQISIERISDVHDVNDECDQFGLKSLATTADPDIEFRNVTFRYPSDLHNLALDNISFSIPAGKITAVVGTSGSGKTTLIKLLLGYYKCTSGNILVSGSDLSEIDIDEWRARIGVVIQNGKIFNDTILKNITLLPDKQDVDWIRLDKAAEIAHIKDFVGRRITGWDTVLAKDGEGLSQGQRQRILIARAVYRDPGILILDEATNSLDTETEKNITDKLTEFCQDRTVIVIAHRLSTVINADNIIVMNNGRILEQGSHEELLRRGGAYYNLIRNQLNQDSNHKYFTHSSI